MNKRSKFFAATLISLSIFICNIYLFAQSNFEGKIVYSISYVNLPPEMNGYEEMLPKDMIILMKGNKSRVEQSQMMGKNIIVSDMEQKTGFVEMDMGGQKLRLNVSTAEFTAEADQFKDIEYLDESKTIAGYPCKKAIMKDAAGNPAIELFYTTKITNPAQKEFMGLKGFPLQYRISQQNMTMEMTANEISEQSVPDKSFEKSDGFKDISQADLQKMMGGAGGR